MSLKIIAIDHHRNGICGAPFAAVLFEDSGPEGGRKLGIVFHEPHHCAVLDIARLAAGDIAFGRNSWRGDQYEPHLRMAIADRPGAEPPVRHWEGRIVVHLADRRGCGHGEAIYRFRAMADRLAKDMPGVKAVVDPGSVRRIDPDETAGEPEAPMKYDAIRAAAFAIDLRRRGEADPAGRVVGLLADARLWCDLNGQNFAELNGRAYRQYLALINHETINR